MPSALVPVLAVLVTLMSPVARTAADVTEATFPFDLESSVKQPATGSPTPASGMQAALYRNTSTATATIQGSGRVVLGATASYCEGWPTLSVTVDGTLRGTVTIKNTSEYGAYTVGAPLGPGTHTVVIGYTNDNMTDTCDRDAFVASAEMEYPPSDAFGSAVLLTDDRIAALKERVAARTQPTYAAWTALLAAADNDLGREPTVPEVWMVPWFYGPDSAKSTEMTAKLRDQANAAYRLALVYRITGDERYATASASQITSWIRGVRTYSTAEDSTLEFAVNFPLMIVAADLLEHSPAFPSTAQQEFATYLRTRTPFALSTLNHANNWGDWGVVLEVSTAAYLGDRPAFDRAATRWKGFIAGQIGANGEMPLEVHRENGEMGIWYSSYALHSLTMAAEIMRANGLDLFDYRSPNGRTLRLAYDRIVGWVYDPTTFPYDKSAQNPGGYRYHIGYWELLNARWPNPQADAVLSYRRPVKDDPMSVGMTFTHGDLR